MKGVLKAPIKAEIDKLTNNLSGLKFVHKLVRTNKNNAVNIGLDYGFVAMSFKADSNSGFIDVGCALICSIYSDGIIVSSQKCMQENVNFWPSNISYSKGVLNFTNVYTGIIDIIAIGTQ